jgi:hypothetical protein
MARNPAENTSALQLHHATQGTALGRKVGSLVDVARNHPTPLASVGFDPNQTTALHHLVQTFESSHAAFERDRLALTIQTQLMVAIVVEAQELRDDFREALRMLARRGVKLPDAIVKPKPLGRSAVRYLAWMVEVQGEIVAFAKELEACMEAPIKRFDDLQARLAAVVASQQEAKRTFKASGVALQQARRAVLQGVQVLRIAGRRAFRHDPVLLKHFRLPHRRKVVQPVPTPASSGESA